MRALEDSVYRIGDALVHIAARSVRRNGEACRLRPKNFDLLVFLIQRRGRIVTKGDLLREVWPDVAVTENSLVKCVSELRKALGDDLRNPQYLQSIPKVGYQLVGAVEEEPAGSPAGVAAVEVQHTTTVELEYREEISMDSGWWERPLAWGAPVAGILLLFGAWHWWTGRRVLPRPAPWHWQEVAWWKLDEGQGAVVHDAAGHGLDGALSPGVSWAAGGGLWFSGLDAAVTGDDHGVLPSGDHARTVSAWIKTTVPPLDATAILAYGNYQRAPNSDFFGAGLLYDGRVSFGSSTPRGSFAGTRRLDDAWHMVTVTYDGPAASAARIFIDGAPDREGFLVDHLATSSESPWKLGRTIAGYTDFRGNIKDVRVFDRALTEPQVAGLFACSAGSKDLGDYYYLPVMLPGFVREPRAPGAASTPFRNDNRDFAGIQLAKSKGECAMTSVEGADAGQDLRISMEVQTPTDAAGNITQAGPYFRSRIAGSGDGLIGGTSAGYWVQLHSNGMIKVRRLNPLSVVAFTAPRPGFDAKIFHQLTTEARGAVLQVWLDGELVQFDQGGRGVDRVDIPPAWETPERVGDNQGAAGVAFGAEDNRSQIGGQRVRNLSVVRLD